MKDQRTQEYIQRDAAIKEKKIKCTIGKESSKALAEK